MTISKYKFRPIFIVFVCSVIILIFPAKTFCQIKTYTLKINQLPKEKCITGLSDRVKEESLSVFPNPSYGVFRVLINHPVLETTVNFSIYSMDGRLIFLKKERINQLHHFELNISSFAKGVYFLRVSGTKFQFFERLIIY